METIFWAALIIITLCMIYYWKYSTDPTPPKLTPTYTIICTKGKRKITRKQLLEILLEIISQLKKCPYFTDQTHNIPTDKLMGLLKSCKNNIKIWCSANKKLHEMLQNQGIDMDIQETVLKSEHSKIMKTEVCTSDDISMKELVVHVYKGFEGIYSELEEEDLKVNQVLGLAEVEMFLKMLRNHIDVDEMIVNNTQPVEYSNTKSIIEEESKGGVWKQNSRSCDTRLNNRSAGGNKRISFATLRQ